MRATLAMILCALGAGAPPHAAIPLLHGEAGQVNLVRLPQAGQGTSTIEATWRMRFGNPTGEGYSFVVWSGNPNGPGTGKDWAEPNLPGCFAVAFDTNDPKTDNIFNGDGNIYDRPQREVSLHWDGVEIANRVSPAEFRTGDWVPAQLKVRYVPGGAEVTLKVAGTPVYDRFFVASMVPFKDGHAAFAAQAVPPGIHLDIDRPMVAWPVAKPAEPALRVSAFHEALNDAAHPALASEVTFPESTAGVGRVVCTLKLDKTPKGIDAWDRGASLSVKDDHGEKFEIVRYITPYRHAFTWRVDVTDYLPLLQGKREVELACTTYGEGWLVSVDFDFFKGKLAQVPYKVEKLWSGWVAIGLPDRPESRFFTPKKLVLDKGLSSAKLRLTVTGHGMAPNTDNAAEFMPIKRTAWVNDHPFENLLWKEDNYLNPCRPQGGTWKFDRAGWGPGDVVRPWDIDITRVVRKGQDNLFRYANAPWVNKTPNEGFLAQHWVEAQVISYRKP